jgi:hypothetical protein
VLKKAILAGATLAVLLVAFQIYRWQEDTPTASRRDTVGDLPERRTPPTPSTQPAGEGGFTLGEAVVPAGQAPLYRVYDRKGNVVIVFRSTEWEPRGSDELILVEPTARILLPGGQLAYVRADEGRVKVQKGDNNDPKPKSGWFRGHVTIFIDLTKPEWRKANPDRAEPEDHPEAVVKIWLDEVHFDLDLTRAESDGPILLQSPRGTIEGEGLTLVWNEVDRQLRELTIPRGKRAILRNVDPVDLKMVGAPDEETGGDSDASSAIPEQAAAPPASPDNEGITFLGDEPAPEPDEQRVDTYRIVFNDDVVAEQKKGIQTVGRLRARMIELLADFGQAERAALEQSPSTRPASSDEQGASPLIERAENTIELTWTGAFEILKPDPGEVPGMGESAPVEKPAGAQVEAPAKRLHLIARGEPVIVDSQDSGRAICRELEYHAETSRIWLRGTNDALVQLEPGPDQYINGEQFFVDQEARTARIEGRGHLKGRRSQADDGLGGGLSLEPDASDRPAGDDELIEVSWTESMEITYGIAEGAKSSTNASPIPSGAYIQQAVFEGDVVFSEPGSFIQADHAEIAFAPPREKDNPPSGGESSGLPAGGFLEHNVQVERIIARGHVHMVRSGQDVEELVDCDQLVVEMAVDDTGERVPRIARAMGNVVARQARKVSKPWAEPTLDVLREIRAEEEVELELVSLPVPVSEAERTRLEQLARERGIEPGSYEWTREEQRLRNRRRIATHRMTASGRVTVHDRPQQLELGADVLDCMFADEDNRISRAFIVGIEDEPAQVDVGDFFIRGPRISLDMTTESAEVPGGGLLQFRSRRDLDGREVDEPIPVVVTWKERMWFEGQKNASRFIGDVHAVSESITVDCRELRLRFEDLPKPPVRTAEASQDKGNDLWIFGPVVAGLRGESEPPPSVTNRASQQMRKRLASIYAVGDAVLQSAVRADDEPGQQGWFTQRIAELLPEALEDAHRLPVDPSSMRLASRLRMAGPQITVDLVNERLGVEGAGNLLIEDYRMQVPEREGRRRSSETGGAISGAAMDTFESLGPSQTLFQWKNSMLFVNDRNLAVFDYDVQMTHWAGSRMAELPRVASAMHVGLADLQVLPGREAGLTCDNLLVEFERIDADTSRSEPSPLSRAARLRSFQALGQIGRVRLEENNRFVIGTKVTYNSVTGTGRVSGSTRMPARLFSRDPRTGRLDSVALESFEWDQHTGRLTAVRPQALATGN